VPGPAPASQCTIRARFSCRPASSPMNMATNAPTYSLGNLDGQNGWSSTAGPWGANADFGAEGVVSSNPVGGASLTGAADDYSVIGGYSTHALDQTYNNSGTVNITFYAYWDGNPAKTGFDGDERVVQVWPLDGSDVEALVVGNFPRNGPAALTGAGSTWNSTWFSGTTPAWYFWDVELDFGAVAAGDENVVSVEVTQLDSNLNPVASETLVTDEPFRNPVSEISSVEFRAAVLGALDSANFTLTATTQFLINWA